MKIICFVNVGSVPRRNDLHQVQDGYSLIIPKEYFLDGLFLSSNWNCLPSCKEDLGSGCYKSFAHKPLPLSVRT